MNGESCYTFAMGSGAATAYPSNMIPPHTKAISKQNTLLCAPQHGEGCFVFVRRRIAIQLFNAAATTLNCISQICCLNVALISCLAIKIFAKPRFRVDPIFLRRYNKNEYENLEVNAGKWTRIIVEVETPARWIRKQKQLRFPQPFASFAESCGKAPLQRCIFPQNRAEEGAALCAQNAAFAAFRQARRRVFCFPICCVLRIQELLLFRKN